MPAARLVAVILFALALAPTAHARVDAQKLTAPEGLRAFLLRADEPKTDTYPRTPSFAWKPVARALRYEFQLSTSSLFRDSGLVYTSKDVKTPALAVPISLPWITGKPTNPPTYALYARLRAVTQTGRTPWTQPFGFNMRWPTVPEPMTTFPGLLRWTPVIGATSYQVWFVDAKTPEWKNGKVIGTTTNVADEREFYTFHQDMKWTSTVRWRVRAVRVLYGETVNALPSVTYGPWSKTYTAVNPPFAVGPLGLSATASEAVMDESEPAEAHRLMPAFVFTGDVASDDTEPVKLYRVYAFTDSDCINVVYKGSIVGSPAFAPRTSGVLKLASTVSATKFAKYLDDGDISGADERSNDGDEVVPTESEKPKAASSGSGDGEAAGEGAAKDEGSSEEGKDESAKNDESAKTDETEKTSGESGSAESLPALEIPPVDLWDNDWPQGGYYWTVVGVRALQPEAVKTKLTSAAAIGATTIVVEDTAGLEQGYALEVGLTPPEVVTIKAISGNTITLEKALTASQAVGADVKVASDAIYYQDVELPQDACEAGRVLRFGKMSEPAVAIAGAPLVSGLSIKGKLISASRTEALFYGPPVVAWNPASGAHAYEVQWSTKTGEDFEPAAKPILTYSTSAVLPLKPGTWYYRVRGLNLSLPKGAQPLSWSEPVKLTVAKPRFSIVKK
jgi:hypothetical protein